MIILILILHQVCPALTDNDQSLSENNKTFLIKAIRNPSELDADKIIIPLVSNGISLGLDHNDHFLVDHHINVPLEMEIISPSNLYMKNLNSLPQDIEKFCNIPEKDQIKHLQSHINAINKIWSEEIQDYESFLYSGTHKRAVVQGLITILLLTYHVTKFYTNKYEQDRYQSTIDELTSKIDSISNTNKLILMASEEILDLQNRYFCESAKKFSKVQDTLAKQLVKNYIRQARHTIENAIQNQLPLTREVNQEITSLCEALNDQNSHLCSTLIIRGMRNTFRGLSTTVDDFGSSIIRIHTILEIPIFSSNQFVSRLSIGNIGFYLDNQRKQIDLPKYAYILNHTDANLPLNTPMIPPCSDINCPPLSQINDLTPNLCLGAIISLNSTGVSEKCRLLDMPDVCVGLHIKSNTFMVAGNGIFTPKNTNLPETIRQPKLVQSGQMVCPGKVLNFRDYNQTQNLITLDMGLNFRNFNTHEVYYDQIDQIFDNLTDLSFQLSNISDSQNISYKLSNLESNLLYGYHISAGISIASLILTLLASIPLIQKCKAFLCNSKKAKIVTFADPELLAPLRFDPRIKSTPNLATNH